MRQLKKMGWMSLLPMLLIACSDEQTNTAATADVTVTVLDGYLYNADVCLDVTGDKRCDMPAQSTNTRGQTTFSINAADNEDYRVLVNVNAGQTVDQDDPDQTVATSYQLRGILGQSIATPMTTIVSKLANDDYSEKNLQGLETLMKVAIAQRTSTLSLFVDYLASSHEDADEVAAAGRAVAAQLPVEFDTMIPQQAYGFLEKARDAIVLAERSITSLNYYELRFRLDGDELQVFYRGNQIEPE